MISKLRLRTDWQVFRVLLTVPLYLMIDSEYGDALFNGYGQDVALLLIFAGFVYSYSGSTSRVKTVMLLGMFVGMAGELIFSLGFGMYHYRLENVPLWLIFGHGLIFSAVYRLSHTPAVWRNRELIQKVLIAFAIVYAFSWLVFANDWYGFLCTLVFLLVLFVAKKSRLFFLIMFVEVCYIELVGTAVGCWYWPEMAFGLYSWLPSANPPSGIAVFYFLFDAAVLLIYLNIINPKTKQRYQKLKLKTDNQTVKLD